MTDHIHGVPASGTYRLLERGEVIQKGDEVLADDTVNWLPLAGWEIGTKWDGGAYMPVRRRTGGVLGRQEPQRFEAGDLPAADVSARPQWAFSRRVVVDIVRRRDEQWRAALGVAPSQAPQMTPELDEVLQFLYGAGPMDGVWFGGVPDGKPRYWWRSYLRDAVKASSTLVAAGKLVNPACGVHGPIPCEGATCTCGVLGNEGGRDAAMSRTAGVTPCDGGKK